MIKYSIFAAVLALSFSVGCQKSTDLGRMQDETIGGAKLYVVELDALQRRADTWIAQSEKAPQTAAGFATAKADLEEAVRELDKLHKLAGSLPTLAATAARSGDGEAIAKVSDETTEELALGLSNVRGRLAKLELWLFNATNAGAQPVVAAIPTPVAVPAGSGMQPPPAAPPAAPPAQH